MEFACTVINGKLGLFSCFLTGAYTPAGFMPMDDTYELLRNTHPDLADRVPTERFDPLYKRILRHTFSIPIVALFVSLLQMQSYIHSYMPDILSLNKKFISMVRVAESVFRAPKRIWIFFLLNIFFLLVYLRS
jgi:hypothetical protein